MNYWKMIYTKWSREEISSWGSLKKTAYILLPLLVYFLIHDAAEILLWAALNQFMLVCSQGTADFLNASSYSVQGMISGLAILIGVAAIWLALKGEISEKEQMDAERRRPKLIDYIVLAALAFLSALGLNMLFFLLGITQSSQAFKETANAQFGVAFFIGLILYGLISPLAEEAVFRGLIYNRMKRCFHMPVAMIVSALLFGCYHGNAVQAVYGSILGLLMAYTYEKYNSFRAPVLYHAVANVGIFSLTYHDRLVNMSSGAGAAVAAVSLAGAGGCLWYISRGFVFKRQN